MDFISLNPVVRSADLYEVLNRTDECIAYDARVIYVISGDLAVTVGGNKLGHLSAGHLLYIPAGVAYKLKGQYFRAAVVTFDLTDELAEPAEKISPVPVKDFDPSRCHSTEHFPPFDKYIHVEDMEAERDSFIQMCNLFSLGEGCYRARISAMLKLILIKVAEVTDSHALPTRMVQALDEYIRENVGDEISNTEIGAIFGYHPFYVSKMLKERKGQTLRQYIITYRLKLAKRMLELTGKGVGEIAEETGFSDSSYFTKTFKGAFGMTPKEYRNKFKDEFI